MLAACAVVAVAGVAVSAIPPTYPDPPLRFWAARRHRLPPLFTLGLHAAPGGPVLPGPDVFVHMDDSHASVFREPSSFSQSLSRILPSWMGYRESEPLFEVLEIDHVPSHPAEGGWMEWHCYTRVTDDLPDGAVPRADLVGTWQEDSENQAWVLRADGTLDRKWRVSLSPGTWGEIDGLVFLRPAGQRCQVRVLLPGRTSWRDGSARFVAERR